MIDFRKAENILSTYSLEEILDWNELSEADILCFLLDEEYLEIPDPKPVDYASDE